MVVVRKIFGSGQVTLPKEWRDKLSSPVIQMTIESDTITIKPLKVDEYETVFDAEEFGYADGVPVEDFLKTLKKVNHG